MKSVHCLRVVEGVKIETDEVCHQFAELLVDSLHRHRPVNDHLPYFFLVVKEVKVARMECLDWGVFVSPDPHKASNRAVVNIDADSVVAQSHFHGQIFDF